AAPSSPEVHEHRLVTLDNFLFPVVRGQFHHVLAGHELPPFLHNRYTQPRTSFGVRWFASYYREDPRVADDSGRPAQRFHICPVRWDPEAKGFRLAKLRLETAAADHYHT